MSNPAVVFQYGLTFGGGLLAKFLWDRIMLERSKDTMIRTLLNEMNHISLLQAESTIVPIPTDVLDNIRASSAFTHLSKDIKFNLSSLYAIISSKNNLLSYLPHIRGTRGKGVNSLHDVLSDQTTRINELINLIIPSLREKIGMNTPILDLETAHTRGE